MQNKLILKAETENNRLDLFIAMRANILSRTQIKRLINDGQVKVNDKVEFRPHYRTHIDDIIEINYEENSDKVNIDIKPTKIDLDIIYEDKDLLVVNKPCGMVTHPANGHFEDTLMNGVLYRYKELSNVGDNVRSGLIHRLDKDTSGVILIGKTNLGLWHYSKLFAEKKIEKTYLAVVVGDMSTRFDSQGKLTIKTLHGRNKFNRKKFSSLRSGFGRMAETEFELINVKLLAKKRYTLVAAHPLTGRTHQIRVHLSEIGFPILGDAIYSNNKYERLMLHSWKLKAKLLNNEIKEFVAPLPQEFKQFIK